MKTEKIKYFLYARKSTESEDRQIVSIESQINELKILADKDSLEITEILSESKSAKIPDNRPVFNSMLERIHKGQAQGIICWKLDRLARNPMDGGQIAWMLQQGLIQHIQTHEKGYYPSDNVLMMSVEFGMANQFIRDLSQNTKRGLKTKAERGWYPVYATLGYMHNPLKKKGEKEIIGVPVRFDLTIKMFELMLAGKYKPPQILKIATNDWGLKTRFNRKVARSTIYRIFNDPFYYGAFEYPKNSGNWYKGKHKPMITEGEYDRIQILLGRKGKPRPKTHRFAYTGLIRCGECGAMITAEEKIKKQKNGNVHRYAYYHCTKRKNPHCSQKTIRQEKLEKQISDTLGKIEIPPIFKDWALNVLKTENEKEFGNRKIIIDAQQKSYNVCIQKIDKLIDMRTSDEITEEEFLKKKSELIKEKMKYQNLLNDSDKNVDGWLDKADQLLNFAETAKINFETGTLEDKKAILTFLGSNLSLKDKKLSIHLSEPLVLIEQASAEVKSISKRLEPLKNRINKKTLEDLYSQSPIMLRR